MYCGMRGLVNCRICVKCLLRFVKAWYPHPSRSLHLQCSNCTTAPMPVKQPWKIWATNAQVSKQKLYNKRYNKTNHGNTMRSERYILVRYTIRRRQGAVCEYWHDMDIGWPMCLIYVYKHSEILWLASPYIRSTHPLHIQLILCHLINI